ncbi:MAG TPA: nucleoside-diphosphate kinase [Candidatus Saccharibacteria bacterium]|nr:nucleoside-diphosphate kinase [Candidatus Saccharibacteria bacterium]HRK94148.1 nucleoside-diphosphate kinase [Candidatus Saccharibacteria bacterium]
MSKNVEQTLVLFKPDALQRALVGEILTRFERVGLRIVGTKMLAPSREHYDAHYEDIGKLKTRAGDQIFAITLDMMQTGPVIAMVLEGIEAVSLVRKLVGATEPKSAAPGTIRGDYSHMSYGYADDEGKGIPNLIHASGDVEEAKQEISHWFTDEELYDYEATHEKFTR